MSQSLRVVIIKPSKYLPDGSVERFRRGFMPNSTVPYMRSMPGDGDQSTMLEADVNQISVNASGTPAADFASTVPGQTRQMKRG